jgi:hypothetical protein
MTVIIGEETELGTAIAINAEKGATTKRKALKTGKLAKLAIKVNSANEATKWRLGILKAASEKPSTFMAETGEITVATKTALTVEGALTAEVELVLGTEYFLVALPLVGAAKTVKVTEKAGFGFKSTAAIKLVEKGVYTEVLNTFGEPAAFWGIEGAASAAEVAATIKVKVKDVAAAQLGQEVAATTKVGVKDTTALLQALSLGATVQVRVKDTPALLQAVSVAGVTKVAIRTATQAKQAQGVAATTTLRIRDTAAVLQAIQIAATTRITLASHVKVTVVTGEGGKKIILLIVDE